MANAAASYYEIVIVAYSQAESLPRAVHHVLMSFVGFFSSLLGFFLFFVVVLGLKRMENCAQRQARYSRHGQSTD